eukprot:CAMPEP_0197848898 /NCGR_PEP_ID=MMETSP1438-20131217/10415_1 /TAXON_ID=1461541 /ORGANISM="Pterosperma sp., Strain CCMP1384" /LENGTH=252 /DNA_ID=CAMNT_0043461353 /DNA_START=111 /DNA_END=869 /DNA_ORIENTATION=+
MAQAFGAQLRPVLQPQRTGLSSTSAHRSLPTQVLRHKARKSSTSFTCRAREIDPNDPLSWRRQPETAYETGEFPTEFLSPEEMEQLLQGLPSKSLAVTATEEAIPVMPTAFGNFNTVEEDYPPDTAAEAIKKGNELSGEGKHQEALDMFLSIEKNKLPGSGILRDRTKPRLLSDGESIAVQYNIACCYSRLGEVESGLLALSEAVTLGFEDVNTLQTDQDLQALRDAYPAQIQTLVEQLRPTKKGFMGFFGF